MVLVDEDSVLGFGCEDVQRGFGEGTHVRRDGVGPPETRCLKYTERHRIGRVLTRFRKDVV